MEIDNIQEVTHELRKSFRVMNELRDMLYLQQREDDDDSLTELLKRFYNEAKIEYHKELKAMKDYQ